MVELRPPATLRDVAAHAGVSITTVERALADSPLVSAASRRKIREAVAELDYMPDVRRDTPTIEDVAKHAGVSIATVSRVLTRSGQVRASTRERVEAALAALQYVPNAHARALSRIGQGQVAVLSASMLGASFTGIAQSIESVVAPLGHQFVVHTTGGDADLEAAHIESLREQRSRAVVVIGGANDDDDYRARMGGYAQLLDSVGCRLILCGRPPVAGLPDVPSVDYDNALGIRSLTERLIELGHRRVAFISGGPETTRNARLAGYLQAMDAAGLDAVQAGGSSWEIEDGMAAAAQLLDGPHPVTAIVASRDLAAVGAIREIRARGLRVPDDVSVTGFDDLPLTADLDPPLTTVRPMAEMIGETVARLVLAREVEPGTAVTLPVEIVLRASIAAAPRSGINNIGAP